MSTTNDPWTVLVHYNNTEDLAKLVAPSWVGTANIRSTLSILQSCVVVLFACICTALHLDVPTKTAWHAVLLSKLGWVLITLFAPEISVYMAIDQLYQARYLRSDLCAIREDDGPGRMDFDIDLKYCFLIVMGGVYVDVDDMLSIADLDQGVFDYKHKLRPFSVRLNPKAIVHLAEKGHWIPISGRKIKGTSKADVLQKILVVGQFYAQSSNRLALFPSKESSEQAPSDSMRWDESIAGSELMSGDVLPSGLRLVWSNGHCNPSVTLEDQFFNRLEAILNVYPFENRVELAQSTEPLPWLPFTSTTQPLYLSHLKEFSPSGTHFFRDMPFGEGKRNIDINFGGPHSLSENFVAVFEIVMIRTFWLRFPKLLVLAMALPFVYGGVHLFAWNFEFASHIEEVLWKISSIYTAAIFPAYLVFEVSLLIVNFYLGSDPEEVPLPLYYTKVGIAGVVVVIYVASRVFIIMEAFLSLRHVPVGVYISPSWIQAIPHF
ncbi:hypothetical protein DER45DRAFT_599269 [Fusarium avenaceum]|nr:hypothetical protein DER45DRAFT_599269 [Fusarium avenaceum]